MNMREGFSNRARATESLNQEWSESTLTGVRLSLTRSANILQVLSGWWQILPQPENGIGDGLPAIQPERQKFGNGPVGVRGPPGPQMRGPRGTHLLGRDSLPWDLGHPPMPLICNEPDLR